MNLENKKAFKEGLKTGVPIGLGYFAVSFSLGTYAKKVGLSATRVCFKPYNTCFGGRFCWV